MEKLDKITLDAQELDNFNYDSLLEKLISLGRQANTAAEELHCAHKMGWDIEEVLLQLAEVEERMGDIREQLINELNEKDIEKQSYEEGEIIAEHGNFIIRAG